MSQFSLRARWIVPVEGPPLENGVITIAGERIVAVGTDASGITIDLGDVVLMPGLVNAHTHLEFSDCEKPLGRPRTPLPDWIRQVIGTRHRSDRNPAAGIERGVAESLRAGVTTIGEIATLSPSAYKGCAGSHLLLFQEVIGFSAARVDSVFSDLEHRVESAATTEFAVGISPHAPYRCILTCSNGLSRRHASELCLWPCTLPSHARNCNSSATAPARFSNCSPIAACGTPRRFPSARGRSITWSVGRGSRELGHPRQLSRRRGDRLPCRTSRSHVGRVLPPHPRLLWARRFTRSRRCLMPECAWCSAPTAAHRTPISTCSRTCALSRSIIHKCRPQPSWKWAPQRARQR